MNSALHDSLFELYIDGGLDLFQAGTRGLKREPIIQLETSALTPEKGEIIHFYAVNRWDEEDVFDEYALRREPLCDLAEDITGLTNERLANCRPSNVVLPEFLAFIDGAKLIAHNLEFDLGFLNNA